MNNKELILIADDNFEVLTFTAMAVEMMGYSAIKAVNGKEALEKAQEHKPDLIIIDWKMPVMDGIEATTCLRNDKHCKDIPIIMITGTNETTELMAEAMEKGVNDFLRKPFIRLELQARIKSLLKQSKYLKQIVEFKNNELNNAALQLAHSIEQRNTILSHLEAIIDITEKPETQAAVSELINKINISTIINPFDKIQAQFTDLNKDFLSNILEVHPKLTPAEIKLCMLLRLNLDTKEIAALLFQTYDSVRVSRTRLREKLNLETSENLVNYIIKF